MDQLLDQLAKTILDINAITDIGQSDSYWAEIFHPLLANIKGDMCVMYYP